VTANVQIVYQPDLFGAIDNKYDVRRISTHETTPFIMGIHYARRMPSVSFAFGLIRDSQLVGVVTYGKPASRPLCVGVCGKQWAPNVIELNRLCLLNNEKNEASHLVAASLKMLPKPSIVVSYADTARNHLGVIYQATNFIYTGTTTPRDEWYVEGLESSHARSLGHLVDSSSKSPIEALQDKFGDRFTRRPRSVKHRYIYFVGTRSDKKLMQAALRYKVQPYPKKDQT
jgi:hypothetical protein